MLNFSEEQLDLVEKCLTEKNEQYNLNKCYEELAEFQEALVKRQTKGRWNTTQPKFKDLFEEFGDVIFRGFIAVSQELGKEGEWCITLTELQDTINQHIAAKLERTKNYNNS